MKQKLGIVQALMHDAPLLILDEPTTALDPLVQEEFLNMLRERREAGTTIVFSSHVLSEVQKLCDRVAILRGGRLIRSDRVEQLPLMKLRRIVVRSRQADALSAELERRQFSPLESSQADGRQVELVAEGRVDELLSVLGRFDIDDLQIRSLGLEEIFAELYRGDPGPESESAR